MTEQTTMTTGQRIRKVVEKLDISEIIFEVERKVGELNWIGNRKEDYVNFIFEGKDIDFIEKVVEILNDLKENQLVSFSIIADQKENHKEIFVSPDITRYK